MCNYPIRTRRAAHGSASINVSMSHLRNPHLSAAAVAVLVATHTKCADFLLQSRARWRCAAPENCTACCEPLPVHVHARHAGSKLSTLLTGARACACLRCSCAHANQRMQFGMFTINTINYIQWHLLCGHGDGQRSPNCSAMTNAA